jgi:hypothetical protein
MSITDNWSQLKIIEYQKIIITDEINTNKDMRPERKRTGEAITPACRQTGMTDKKTINIYI